jgi:M3 family oligoendopeptidase
VPDCVRFSELRFVRPDFDSMESEFEALHRDIQRADGPALLNAVERWMRIACHYMTHSHLNRIATTLDVHDEAAKREHAYFIEHGTRYAEWDARTKQLLVTHPHRQAIDERHGEVFLRLMECEMSTFDPRISAHLQEEARLIDAYQNARAAARIEFRGASYSLGGIRRFDFESDRATREAGARAQDELHARQVPDFDRIFDELVLLRHETARALGYENYIEFGYRRRNRIFYGPEQIAAFRRQIVDTVVPLVEDLRRRQAEVLGVDQVMPWDSPILDLRDTPTPRGGVAGIIEHTARMLAELSPETGAFFDAMRSGGYLDLEARDGKAPGGLCYYLPEPQMPFMLLNMNGSMNDVRAFTHECGHAFQKYCCRHHTVVDYALPTKEIAEIHSIGLEFLAWPWSHLYFGDEAYRFHRSSLLDQVFLIAKVSLADEFQHFVYANPHCGAEARAAEWLALQKKYRSGIGDGNLETMRAGRSWHQIGLMFTRPFYYIDYALAATCAMQLWRKAQDDHAAAFADYLALCRAGGSKTFDELLAIGGLGSPFEDGVIQEVVELAREWPGVRDYGSGVRVHGGSARAHGSSVRAHGSGVRAR